MGISGSGEQNGQLRMKAVRLTACCCCSFHLLFFVFVFSLLADLNLFSFFLQTNTYIGTNKHTTTHTTKHTDKNTQTHTKHEQTFTCIIERLIKLVLIKDGTKKK